MPKHMLSIVFLLNLKTTSHTSKLDEVNGSVQ